MKSTTTRSCRFMNRQICSALRKIAFVSCIFGVPVSTSSHADEIDGATKLSCVPRILKSLGAEPNENDISTFTIDNRDRTLTERTSLGSQRLVTREWNEEFIVAEHPSPGIQFNSTPPLTSRSMYTFRRYKGDLVTWNDYRDPQGNSVHGEALESIAKELGVYGRRGPLGMSRAAVPWDCVKSVRQF